MIRTTALPKHRDDVDADALPLARCLDNRNSYDGGCIEPECPRHDPAWYADQYAKHRKETAR